MKLTELKSKHPSQMTKEELELYMLHILEDMNMELEKINEEYSNTLHNYAIVG